MRLAGGANESGDSKNRHALEFGCCGETVEEDSVCGVNPKKESSVDEPDDAPNVDCADSLSDVVNPRNELSASLVSVDGISRPIHSTGLIPRLRFAPQLPSEIFHFPC